MSDFKYNVNFFSLVGILFLFMSMVSFLMYFHVIDNLVNYQGLTIDNKVAEIEEISVNGKYIGGYDEQHQKANYLFCITFGFLLFSFISFILGMINKKWTNKKK
jgi:hypothetical protein